MKKRLCLLLALIMLFSVFAAACGGGGNEEPEGDTAADTSLEAIQEKGELILGLDDSFPPMGFKD